MQNYLKLGPTTPYLIRSANTFCAGDFDGDGRVEVASYCPANKSLNILSYFEYSDVSPQWAGQPPQMVNAWSCMATIPPATGVALNWIERSADAREFQACYFAVNPVFRDLRNAPGS